MKVLKSSHLWMLFLVLTMGISCLYAQSNELYQGPIIDMHMHAINELNDGYRYRPCYPRPCQGLPRIAQSPEEVFDMTINAMKRYKIVLGYLSNAWIDIEDLYKWVEAEPDRFLASPFICDPSDVDLDFLKGEYEAGRLFGMGEVASQYCGLAIDDPKLNMIFNLAEEFDIPVHVHSHGTGAPTEKFRISLGNPLRIEEVVKKYPDLRIFIEDAGFPFLEETVALMYNYPNVYGEIGNLGWMKPRAVFYKYLRELAEYGLAKRIFFGTDAPQLPEVISEVVEAIQSADFLTYDQKADIFYGNAARFLKLSEEQIASHHGN